MKHLHFAGPSVLALSVALLSGAGYAAPVSAAHTVTVNPADYNAAQVVSTQGIVTVPANPALAIYSVHQGSLEVNSRFSVTLPSGFSFGSQPPLYASNGTSILALLSGGIGSRSATFQVGVAPLSAGESVSLGSFAVEGATALETPIPLADALPLSLQATNNSLISNDDAAPIVVGAFASEPGLSVNYGGNLLYVDLTSPSLGQQFINFPPPLVGSIGQVVFTPQFLDSTSTVPVLSPNGQPNSLSTNDTATITVTGFFNGITSTFTSTTPNCIDSVVQGTVTGTQAVLPDVSLGRLDGGFAFICFGASGTSLIAENPQGFQPVIAPGKGTTDFLTLNSTLINQSGILYTGGGVLSVTNFFTGDDSGYVSLLRVNNAGTGAVTLYPVVQPDSGGPLLFGSLGTLAGGTGAVFTEPQLQAAVSGLNLANSGQRATLQLIVAGDAVDVAATGLLVNPTGAVTPMSGNSPPQ